MGQSRMDNLKTQATLDTRHRQHWTQDTEGRQQSKRTTIEN